MQEKKVKGIKKVKCSRLLPTTSAGHRSVSNLIREEKGLRIRAMKTNERLKNENERKLKCSVMSQHTFPPARVTKNPVIDNSGNNSNYIEDA